MTKRYLGFVAASLLAAGLAGCGSSGDSGGDQTLGQVGEFGANEAGIQFVGAGTCINCHQTLSFSDEEVAGYLEGKHVIHSSDIDATIAQNEGCFVCHDPIGEGATVAPFIDPANVPAGGLAAVGCEACHGAGGEHFGVGPIPMPMPDFNTCGGDVFGNAGARCHVELPPDHLPFHPLGNNIFTRYTSSPHAESGDRPEAPCVRCHTDEGGRLYKNVETFEGLVTIQPLEDVSPVQCRTCHDPHNVGNALLEDEVREGRQDVLVASAGYATCTNCHQEHDAQLNEFQTLPGVTPTATTDGGSGDLLYHAARWDRVIATTHHDNPATSAQSAALDPTDPNFRENQIEGYVMDPTDEAVCVQCHDVHSADTTINNQWAESAHGGRLITQKEAAAEAAADDTVEQTAAVMAAGVTSETGDAWIHYDWDAQNRQTCQRCHTSTGLMNFLQAQITQNDDDPANNVEYDPVNNDFTHLEGWSMAEDGTVASSGQNEMLFCWGCHSNTTTGTLRNPGQITLDFEFLETPEQLPSGERTFVVLPDKGKANVCGACHSGRGNDTSIRDSYAEGSLSSRFAGHHAPTAGSLYAEVTHTGFEFAGQDYTPIPAFAHDDILVTGDSPETGDGPCVGCHFAGTANHTFEAVDRDDLGAITALRSQELCNTCHGVITSQMSAEVLSTLKAQFEDARAVLNEFATNTAPNLNYRDLDITAGANRTTDILTLNDYGSFQNNLYMTEEPCIYVHNDTYGKRLIFDTIDWLDGDTNADGNNLDGTITIDAAVHPGAVAWLDADPATPAIERP